MECRRILFEGQVQGVGFRRQTFGIAQKFAVKGYVRNLPNGNVELLVQGESEEIDRFLEAIAQRMKEFIERQSVSSSPLQEFQDFSVRF